MRGPVGVAVVGGGFGDEGDGLWRVGVGVGVMVGVGDDVFDDDAEDVALLGVLLGPTVLDGTPLDGTPLDEMPDDEMPDDAGGGEVTGAVHAATAPPAAVSTAIATSNIRPDRHEQLPDMRRIALSFFHLAL